MRVETNEVVDLIKPKFVVTNPAYTRVYLPGQRPARPSNSDEPAMRAYFPYVVIYPSRRFASDIRRLSDDSSIWAFRVVTMAVGRTEGEVLYAEEKVAEALEGARIVVNGYSSTPFHFESSAPAEPDQDVEDLYTSSTAWTTVLTKQQAA